MGGFSELIKNFDKTRDYVRDFFIYGFKVRGDFSRKSSRTYDDEKRRVESWLGDFMRQDDSVRGKQISISVNSGHVCENPLYQAYYSKSFTDNDIRLHFLLIDLLSQGKAMTLKELTDSLNAEYGFVFDEQTVRNKLKEYVSEGIIISEKQGKTAYFRLSPDTADSFLNEYKGLSNAVRFFSQTQEFGIIGNSILKDAGLENDLFLMKHSYIVHTLEDEVLTDILSAIRQKKYISIISFKSSSSPENTTSPDGNTVVPMQIFSSVQTGRRYLAAFVPGYKRFNALRLDSIRSVKIREECGEYSSLHEAFVRNTEKCFGVSFGMRHDTGTVTPMKITFYADEETEDYIIGRLMREKRCGVLEKTGNNLFTVTFNVFDPTEVMHWAKTFIGRIVSVEGGCRRVRDTFSEDVRRMYEMYGGDSV